MTSRNRQTAKGKTSQQRSTLSHSTTIPTAEISRGIEPSSTPSSAFTSTLPGSSKHVSARQLAVKDTHQKMKVFCSAQSFKFECRSSRLMSKLNSKLAIINLISAQANLSPIQTCLPTRQGRNTGLISSLAGPTNRAGSKVSGFVKFAAEWNAGYWFTASIVCSISAVCDNAKTRIGLHLPARTFRKPSRRLCP